MWTPEKEARYQYIDGLGPDITAAEGAEWHRLKQERDSRPSVGVVIRDPQGEHGAAIRESLAAGHKPVMRQATATTYIFKQVLDMQGDASREVITNKPLRFQFKNEKCTPRIMQAVAEIVFIFFDGDPRKFNLTEYRNEIYIGA